jgi:hypothetical protein
MTRAEASRVLAARLGWAARQHGPIYWRLYDPHGHGFSFHTNEAAAWECGPDYFTNIYAARELVRWFVNQENFQQLFLDAITRILLEAEQARAPNALHPVYLALLATPEVLTRAACDVFGIAIKDSPCQLLNKPL